MANKNNGIAMIENKLALKSAADSGVAKRAEPSKRIKSPNKRNAAIKAAIRFMFFMYIPRYSEIVSLDFLYV